MTALVVAGTLAVPGLAQADGRHGTVVTETFAEGAQSASSAHWTPERRAAARPMRGETAPSPSAGPPREAAKGGKPGGGSGGDGGGGSNDTLGESWVNNPDTSDDVADTTGKLFFTTDTNVDSWCTASVVKSTHRNVLVTAGHCVHKKADPTGDFFTDFLFEPAFDDDVASPHGAWTVQAIVTPTEWASTNQNDLYKQYEYDVAFVVLVAREDGLNIEDVVGGQDILFDWDLTASDPYLYSFGYPRNRAGKTVWDGGDLIHCASPAIALPEEFEAPLATGVACKMQGGSSGGPRLANFDQASGTGSVVSVNSWSGYDRDVLWGPTFGQDARDAYVAASANPTADATS